MIQFVVIWSCFLLFIARGRDLQHWYNISLMVVFVRQTLPPIVMLLIIITSLIFNNKKVTQEMVVFINYLIMAQRWIELWDGGYVLFGCKFFTTFLKNKNHAWGFRFCTVLVFSLLKREYMSILLLNIEVLILLLIFFLQIKTM